MGADATKPLFSPLRVTTLFFWSCVKLGICWHWSFPEGNQFNSASWVCVIATDNSFGQAFVGMAEKSNPAYFEVLPALLPSKAKHLKLC